MNDIDIQEIFVKTNAGKDIVSYTVSDTVPNIGSKLTIDLPTKTDGKLVNCHCMHILKFILIRFTLQFKAGS